MAREESATGQLIMIDAEFSLPTGSTPTNIDANADKYKYYFRRGPGILEYFQVTIERGGEPELFSSAIVNPDDDIPDLIPFYEAQTLGLDILEANRIAWQRASSVTTTMPQTIKGKYIRATPTTTNGQAEATNIWQVSYIFGEGSGLENLVFQIDASNGTILYTNMITPTPTPTEETEAVDSETAS
jgi:hypothetical protein